jgi:hypothetical protein
MEIFKWKCGKCEGINFIEHQQCQFCDETIPQIVYDSFVLINAMIKTMEARGRGEPFKHEMVTASTYRDVEGSINGIIMLLMEIIKGSMSTNRSQVSRHVIRQHFSEIVRYFKTHGNAELGGPNNFTSTNSTVWFSMVLKSLIESNQTHGDPLHTALQNYDLITSLMEQGKLKKDELDDLLRDVVASNYPVN